MTAGAKLVHPWFRRLFVVSMPEAGRRAGQGVAIYMGDEHGHGPHIQGYLHAAEAVRETMEEIGFENTLIYPALHLIRHAAELSLKEAIDKQSLVKPAKLWSTHDLRWLAEEFQRVYHHELDAWWRPYHELLTRWQDADPDGLFFRYCRSRDGTVVDLGQDSRLTIEQVWQPAREAVQIIVGIADL